MEIQKYKKFYQCGINHNCITDSIMIILKYNELNQKIVEYINKGLTIPPGLSDMHRLAYKEFSKTFFSRNTIECLLKNCKSVIPPIDKELEKSRKRLELFLKRAEKIKHTRQIISYIKVINTCIYIIDDFVVKFNKYYNN